MEKLVVTRRKGGSFESRSLQACPLQPRHASQRKKGNRNGVGVPLERGSERTAAPAQRCNRHNERIPYRSGSEQRGRSATVRANRERAGGELRRHRLWRARRPRSLPPAGSFIENGSQTNQAVYQELR